MKATCFFFLYFLISLIAWNQTNASFYNVAFEMDLYQYYYGGNFGTGVSFFDFDEDGWDDITICHQSGPSFIYKNNSGIFEVFQAFEIQAGKSCAWGDLNNDGTNELVFTTIHSGIQVFQRESDGFYHNVLDNFNWMDQVPSTNGLWLYGLSLADVNQDHLLDIAVATYQGETPNFLFLNEGNLQFTLDFNNALKYEQKMSFQPAFIDINKDNKTDLYFANDFEEGNDFYINETVGNGNSSWNNASTTTGLDINVNGMCNSWCDFDNDLDLDVYVSNLDPGNFLMANNNAVFSNIAPNLGLAVYGKCWSSLWIDADNDQWSDLLVSSAHADMDYNDWNGYYFSALGEGNFSEMDTNIFTSSSYSACKGDFNHDGLYDIALNAANNDFFKLYENTTNSSNHFLQFKPIGHISNRNGVGVHYYLYTADNAQYGYTQSGDNYLGQNSQNLILGLGENQTIDSLILFWPSGIIDKYFNLPIDQSHSLHEGQSGWGLSLNAEKVCSLQDSILATMDPLFEVIWNNNVSTQDVWLHPGDHEALIQFEGITIDTVPFTIALFDDNELTTSIIAEHCLGQDGAINIMYQNDTLFNATHLSDGPFIATYEDNNGCPALDTLTVPSDDAFAPIVTTIPAPCQIGSSGMILISEETDITYTITPSIDINNTPPGAYVMHFNNTNGCVLDTTIMVQAEQQWVIQIPPTIHSCFGEDVQTAEWITSNLEIAYYHQWPMDILNHDTTIVVEMETIQGCAVSDTILFHLLLPPSYDTLQTNTLEGTLVTITTAENSTVYFDSNASNQLFCTESQWQTLVLVQDQCQWQDSIWIQVNIPQHIDFKAADSNVWIQNGNELFFKTTHKTLEIIQIVNTLGQEIGFRSLGDNHWIMHSSAFPVFIQTAQGWIKTQVQN